MKNEEQNDKNHPLEGIPYYEITPQKENPFYKPEITSELLKVAAELVLTGLSEDFGEWCFSKSTPFKDKQKVIKSAISYNEHNKALARRLKKLYEYISSLRPKVEIESVEYVMRKTCSRTEWECNCGLDGSTCENCGTHFEFKRLRKYCSDSCKKKSYYKRKCQRQQSE